MNLNFPYQFDGRGRTREAALQDYVRQLVEQVLFTSPGERVNLPDFGSGLLQLPFAPNSVEMAAATQFAVQGALQKWLSALHQGPVGRRLGAGRRADRHRHLLAAQHRRDPGADLRLREAAHDLQLLQREPQEPRSSAIPTLNGIDYLEVLDSGAPPGVPRQQTLLVHCLNPLSPR